jgi:ribosome production factor 1
VDGEQGHGRAAHLKPELILNHFDTRLGHRLGRMLASLFHQDPNFKSRQVATFHNQRDCIFFRWRPLKILSLSYTFSSF